MGKSFKSSFQNNSHFWPTTAAISSEAIIGIAFGLSATIISIIAIILSMQTQKYRIAQSKRPISQICFHNCAWSQYLPLLPHTNKLRLHTFQFTTVKLTNCRTDNSDLELQAQTQNAVSFPSTANQSSAALLTTDTEAAETNAMRPYAIRILEIVSDLSTTISTTRREQE